MFRIPVLLGWSAVLGFYGICRSTADQTHVTFTFKEYQYKDSPKNVRNKLKDGFKKHHTKNNKYHK